MRSVEIFYGRVCDPFIDLIVTHRDKAVELTVKSVADGKSDVAAVAVIREV